MTIHVASHQIAEAPVISNFKDFQSYLYNNPLPDTIFIYEDGGINSKEYADYVHSFCVNLKIKEPQIFTIRYEKRKDE